MKNNKPYISADIGLPIARSPYVFNDAKLSLLFLECDSEKIQAQLDKYINNPSNGDCDYRALSMDGICYLVMIMADMKFVASNNSGKAFGTIQYPESSFWIPAFDVKNLKPGLFLPLLLLDNGTAIASGREAYGFEKQQAQFEFLNASNQLDIEHPNYIMSPYSFTELSAQTQGQYNPLIQVSGGGSSTEKDDGSHLFKDAGSILKHLAKHWFPGSISVGGASKPIALDDFFDPEIPLPCVFLKQFPAVENAELSCFQQVTFAPFHLTAINSGGVYWDWSSLGLRKFDIEIFPLESHPIIESFGLKAEKQSNGHYKMQASGLWLNINFTLELGE